MQHTPKSPLHRGELKRRKEEKKQHTPKSPLHRGELKRRKEEKKQHTLRSYLDKGDLKKGNANIVWHCCEKVQNISLE